MTEPTLAEIFRVSAENRERDLFTSLVGVVQKYTPGPPGPPVVDVLPVIKRAVPGAGGVITHEELPIIPNVPVVFPSATDVSITWPITKGDHVLLICTNWSHQQWRETGSPSEPGFLATHELGNAFAIAGVLPKTGTLATGLGIEITAPEINIATPGNVNVDAALVSVGTALQEFVVLADKLTTELNAHTHAAGGFMAPSGGGAVTGVSGAPSPAFMASDYEAAKLESE